VAWDGEEDVVLLGLAAVGGNLVGLDVVLIYGFDRVHGVCFNERKPLDESNGFNTIMKKNLLLFTGRKNCLPYSSRNGSRWWRQIGFD
jgi:hypothetical protein